MRLYKTSKQTSYSERNFQLEFIRAICTICVVAIHTINSGLIYTRNGNSFVIECATVIKNLLYWAVPCFAMITGYLLCDPNKPLSFKKLYGHYFIRIATVLLLFGTGFSWLEIIFNEKSIAFYQLLQAIKNVFTNQTWAHLWYLYALLIVYIFLPVLRQIMKIRSDKIIFCIILAMVVLQLLTHNRYFSINTYVLIGGFIKRNEFESNKNILFITLILSSFTIVVCSITGTSILIGYPSPLTVVQSYSVFRLLYMTHFPDQGQSKMILCKVAKNSFGIYLLHMVFVNIEYQVLKLQVMQNLSFILILVVLIVVNLMLSYAFVVLLKKIPGVKNLI